MRFKEDFAPVRVVFGGETVWSRTWSSPGEAPKRASDDPSDLVIAGALPDIVQLASAPLVGGVPQSDRRARPGRAGPHRRRPREDRGQPHARSPPAAAARDNGPEHGLADSPPWQSNAGTDADGRSSRRSSSSRTAPTSSSRASPSTASPRTRCWARAPPSATTRKAARAYFNKALAGCHPQERQALRRMMQASMALAERRPDDLKAAVEKLGQAPPSSRQLFMLRLMGLVAPPQSAGMLLRVARDPHPDRPRGRCCSRSASAWRSSIALPFGGVGTIGAILLGLLIVAGGPGRARAASDAADRRGCRPSGRRAARLALADRRLLDHDGLQRLPCRRSRGRPARRWCSPSQALRRPCRAARSRAAARVRAGDDVELAARGAGRLRARSWPSRRRRWCTGRRAGGLSAWSSPGRRCRCPSDRRPGSRSPGTMRWKKVPS